MIITLTSETQSDIHMCYDETGIQLIPEDHQLTLHETFEGVRFMTSDGEELVVMMRDSGFEFVYILDPDDNIEQWYSLNNGFVRRLSIKKGASEGNGSIDNVVPFPPK